MPLYGGAEKVIVRLANHFHEQGHETAIAMPDFPSGMTDELDSRVALHKIKLWQAVSLCRRYGVVIAHNFPATVPAVLARRPVIWWCHEPPEAFSTPWRKPIEAIHRVLVKHGADNIIVASKFTHEEVIGWYRRVGVVLPYGCDGDYYGAPSQVGDWPDWDEFVEHEHSLGKLVVAQVGTIQHYKGAHVTLKAAHSAGVPVSVALVGHVADIHYFEVLKHYCEFQYFAHQKPTQLRRLFQTADILCHPCVGQGGWLVPFEAMAAGACVIVDKGAAFAGFMERNRLPGVSEDIGFAFASYTANREGWRGEAKRSSEWVRANMTWEAFGDKMLAYCAEVYVEVL